MAEPQILIDPDQIKQKILSGAVFEINGKLFYLKNPKIKNLYSINGNFYGHLVTKNFNIEIYRTFIGQQIKTVIPYEKITMFK